MTETQCQETVFGPRVQSWQCTRDGVVQRADKQGRKKWYCRQHDPENVRRRDKARADKFQTEQAASTAVEEEGDRLARRLWLKDTSVLFDSKTFKYVRCLVIPFDEVAKLTRKK